MKPYSLAIAVIFAAAPWPQANREATGHWNSQASPFKMTSSTNYLDDLCEYAEKNKQRQCAELCRGSELYTLTGGICGIGSTCSCN